MPNLVAVPADMRKYLVKAINTVIHAVNNHNKKPITQFELMSKNQGVSIVIISNMQYLVLDT